MATKIRPNTVKLIAKILHPLAENGVLTIPEEREIIAHLTYLAQKGEELPAIMPKLIDQKEAAEMLGIGFSNFKKLEKSNAFPFKRRMVGTSVRYRNTDIIKFILSEDPSEINI